MQHQDLTLKIVTIASAYGVVHFFADDLEIKPGRKQNELIKKLPIQILLLYSAAYSMTADIELAAITTFIFYFLKYFLSDEDEESKKCTLK